MALALSENLVGSRPGCSQSTAGGALSLAGMGCGGYAPRTCAGLGLSSHIIWMINTPRSSAPFMAGLAA